MKIRDREQGLTDSEYERAVEEHSGLVRKAIIGVFPGVDYDRELDDLEQEAWLRAWEARSTFRAELSRLSTWLHNIAVSVAQNYLRDESRRPTLVVESDIEESDPDSEECDASWLEHNYVHGDDPEAILMAEEQVEEGLRSLSQQERQVFELVHNNGVSPADVADLLGVSHSSIRTVLQRIHAKIIQLRL